MEQLLLYLTALMVGYVLGDTVRQIRQSEPKIYECENGTVVEVDGRKIIILKEDNESNRN